MTVMADFILLGHQGTGSYALSSDKSQLFKEAIKTYLDIICEVFNRQAIPRLIEANGQHFQGITDYPKLVHGDVEHIDLGVLGDFLQKMSASGILMPDEDMEDYVREAAQLPERTASRRTSANTRAASGRGREAEPQEDDPETIEAARKRLGRR